MRYATLADVEAGFRTLEEDEQRRCLACSKAHQQDRKQKLSLAQRIWTVIFVISLAYSGKIPPAVQIRECQRVDSILTDPHDQSADLACQTFAEK